MKTAYLKLTVAALFAAVSVASAQDAASTEKSFGGTVVGTEHITAKVKKVDPKTREITLKGPEGKKVTFYAGPEVRNFDRIKKGDNVNISYTESVTVMVSGAGAAEPSRKETREVTRAAPGETPAGAITETMEAYGVVTDMDYNGRIATLKCPDRTIKVHAGEEAQNFNKVKVGDNVHIKYTRRLAAEVID